MTKAIEPHIAGFTLLHHPGSNKGTAIAEAEQPRFRAEISLTFAVTTVAFTFWIDAYYVFPLMLICATASYGVFRHRTTS